jgi:hypothetical protein
MFITFHSALAAIKGDLLAKPNYQFEKRQKALAKKSKQEEKRRQKLANKAADDSSDNVTANPSEALPSNDGGVAVTLPDSGTTPEA